jgi:hypothetical protein
MVWGGGVGYGGVALWSVSRSSSEGRGPKLFFFNSSRFLFIPNPQDFPISGGTCLTSREVLSDQTGWRYGLYGGTYYTDPHADQTAISRANGVMTRIKYDIYQCQAGQHVNMDGWGYVSGTCTRCTRGVKYPVPVPGY